MQTKYPTQNTIVLQINDFSKGLRLDKDQNIADIQTSVDTFNFDFSSGALKDCVDFDYLTLPTSEEFGSDEVRPKSPESENVLHFTKIAHLKIYSDDEQKRDDDLFVFTDKNEVFRTKMISSSPKFEKVAEATFVGKPRTYNCRLGGTDYLLVFDSKDQLKLWSEDSKGFLSMPDTPNITDYCRYADYNVGIIGDQQDTIRFDEVYPTNWMVDKPHRGIDIKLSDAYGSANRLLSFKDYVFIVRDFGISRLAWYKSTGTYSINNLVYPGSKIYGETACICGDKGLVLCSDGIYEFNSVSAKKLDLPFNKLLEGVTNKYACATFKGGKYYLACQLNFNDDQKINCEYITHHNNVLIVLDTETNSYTLLRGLDINDLCTVQYASVDKVLATFYSNFKSQIGQIGHSGKNFNFLIVRYWQSPLSDLGYPDKEKLVREISINTKENVYFKIFTENDSKTILINGRDKPVRIPIKIKGNKIGFSLQTITEKVCISDLKIKLDLLDKEYEVLH